MAYESDASVSTLIRGALDDARELMREEVALARAEMRQEASKMAAAGVQFGVAGVSLWFAGMFLLIAIALGIAAALAWPVWAGFALVSVILGIAGAVMFVSARQAMGRVEPLPRTVSSIKENFQ